MNKKLTEKLNKKLKNYESQNSSLKMNHNIGLKISMEMVSSIIAGILIGLGLDKIFSTKPIFFIIFLLLGIITSFYNLYKSVKKLN